MSRLKQDILEGIKNNYYKGPDGKIVKVTGVELLYREKSESPYFVGHIIERLERTRDVYSGLHIEIHLEDVDKYEQLSDSELQVLRNQSINLEKLTLTNYQFFLPLLTTNP